MPRAQCTFPDIGAKLNRARLCLSSCAVGGSAGRSVSDQDGLGLGQEGSGRFQLHGQAQELRQGEHTFSSAQKLPERYENTYRRDVPF